MTQCQIRYAYRVPNRKGCATASIVGVLKQNEPAYGEMLVVATNCGFHLLETERSIRLVLHYAGMDSAQRRYTSGLINVGM